MLIANVDAALFVNLMFALLLLIQGLDHPGVSIT